MSRTVHKCIAYSFFLPFLNFSFHSVPTDSIAMHSSTSRAVLKLADAYFQLVLHYRLQEKIGYKIKKKG